MREDEVAGFRVLFDEGGKWVEAPGFVGWSGVEREAEQGTALRKVSGQRKYQNINLKRGADTSRQTWIKWRPEADGRYAAKNLQVELLDAQGQVIHTYAFKQGFPVKWAGPSLNACGGEVAMEELTVAFEGLEIS